ncbi:unnamed protein product [Tilletia caries]|nr:unnamed protein product [Tilletia caries]
MASTGILSMSAKAEAMYPRTISRNEGGVALDAGSRGGGAGATSGGSRRTQTRTCRPRLQALFSGPPGPALADIVWVAPRMPMPLAAPPSVHQRETTPGSPYFGNGRRTNTLPLRKMWTGSTSTPST